ncbi:MAG: cobyrinate a,c-diamide synthase [Desulfobacterales bacterium]|nr:cobyrinate a,c-diamide synthase [Desulfobacterales bacterium]
MKGLVIGGTFSGCGKTTLTLGLMAAFIRRGLQVAPFKVGPDFIDPGHHTRVTGVAGRNLDGWMLSKLYNLECFRKQMLNADIAVVEGVMGLFDGYDGKSEAGSTAQMAKWIDLPVVLIVDAKSMARSAAALVQGFERFDQDLKFVGVIFNNVASQRHLAYLKEALWDNVQMPCIGGMIHDKEIEIPERHLGLVTRQDFHFSDKNITRLADSIDAHLDVDMLLELLPEKKDSDIKRPLAAVSEKISRVRIGVAMDNAFCFYYPDNLELLEEYGAEIVYFSPINDNNLPPNLDGIYLGGGYPELFAKQLTDNAPIRRQIKEKSIAGMPIYAECGGFMYLCREIEDADGKTYPMSGCFPFSTQMFTRLKALGYREITTLKDTALGKKGQIIRGHEFHYSEITTPSPATCTDTVYAVSSRYGQKEITEGYKIANTLGSYIHLHFGSCPNAAEHFVETCFSYKNSG